MSDRLEGGAREFGGRIKDAAGGLTGDAKTQGEGKLDQLAGKAQQQYGAAVDATTPAEGAFRSNNWRTRRAP